MENIHAGSETEATSMVQKVLNMNEISVIHVINSERNHQDERLSANNSESGGNNFTLQVQFSRKSCLDESI